MWRLPLLEVDIDLRQRRVAIHDDLQKVRRTRLVWIVGLLLMLAFSILMLRYGGLRFHGSFLFAFAICGTFAYRYYRRSKDAAPDLILTPEGFNDRWIGAGVVPWRYVVAYAGTFAGEPGVFLDEGRLMNWVSHSMPNDWMSLTMRVSTHPDIYKHIVVPTDAPVTLLNTDAGTNLTVTPNDILWLLSHYTRVVGLPEGYSPIHPELRRLPPNALGSRIVAAEPAKSEPAP